MAGIYICQKITADVRQIILAVKEEYANFNQEGVHEIQLRNMQYKLQAYGAS
jgi:hypothetical protein